MATYGWGWQEATCVSNSDSVITAEGTSTNYMFNKKLFPLARKNCKLSYNSRTKAHEGYLNVDMNSLQESATLGEVWPQDETPWELRYVRQRFLHEQSLSFSRNWFGNLVRASGNDRIKVPVCKPKSMECSCVLFQIPEIGLQNGTRHGVDANVHDRRHRKDRSIVINLVWIPTENRK